MPAWGSERQEGWQEPGPSAAVCSPAGHGNTGAGEGRLHPPRAVRSATEPGQHHPLRGLGFLLKMQFGGNPRWNRERRGRGSGNMVGGAGSGRIWPESRPAAEVEERGRWRRHCEGVGHDGVHLFDGFGIGLGGVALPRRGLNFGLAPLSPNSD
jgi:hypothetical protein